MLNKWMHIRSLVCCNSLYENPLFSKALFMHFSECQVGLYLWLAICGSSGVTWENCSCLTKHDHKPFPNVNACYFFVQIIAFEHLKLNISR